MTLEVVVRTIDVLMAFGVTIAYTFVMLFRQRTHGYAGYAQLWRFIGVWSLGVVITAYQARGIYNHTPLTTLTWMLTLALVTNCVAVWLTVREMMHHISQVDTVRQ